MCASAWVNVAVARRNLSNSSAPIPYTAPNNQGHEQRQRVGGKKAKGNPHDGHGTQGECGWEKNSIHVYQLTSLLNASMSPMAGCRRTSNSASKASSNSRAHPRHRIIGLPGARKHLLVKFEQLLKALFE
jgi:hypothetical protein